MKFLNESFFHFFLGFVSMLMVSLGLTFAINFYDGGKQTASASKTIESMQVAEPTR